MKLVIAEKPSVAQAIAHVLGATARKDGYTEGGGWLVSWCVGHLVGLAPADAYDPRYSKWAYDDLPIVPECWQFAADRDKEKQLAVLRALMGREDVDAVVCATDAGREGQLIFQLVYDFCGCKKPTLRLWISSMEETAIKDGFAALKDGAAYESLYRSALCRAQADWLIGINATRLFSVLYGATLNVGRVQSPTLALLVNREAEIAGFKKQKFYTVQLMAGGFTAEGDRLDDKKTAEDVRAACGGKTATVEKVERKERAELPPKLYDLTTLQREANRLYGFTAQQTLDYTQSLYEKKAGDISPHGFPVSHRGHGGGAAVAGGGCGRGAALHGRAGNDSERRARGGQRQGVRPSRHYPHPLHAGGRPCGAACRGKGRAVPDRRPAAVRRGGKIRHRRNRGRPLLRRPHLHGQGPDSDGDRLEKH